MSSYNLLCKYTTPLTGHKSIVAIKKSSIGQEALHSGRRWPREAESHLFYPSKGGEAYADYITYREIYRYDNRKEQQPPLGQVNGCLSNS